MDYPARAPTAAEVADDVDDDAEVDTAKATRPNFNFITHNKKLTNIRSQTIKPY